MKKKQAVKIIAGVAVLALIIIGVIFALKPSDNKDSENPAPTDSPLYTVFSVNAEDITQVEWSSGSEKLEFKKDADKWSIAGVASETIAQSKVNTFIQSVANIRSSREIGGEENPEEYGLKEPNTVITVTANGETSEIFIGDTSPTLGEVFIMKKEGPIYTVSAKMAENLTRNLEYYQDFNRFGVDTESITSVSIEKKGEAPIELSVKEDINLRTYNVWQIKSPYSEAQNANDEYVDEKILSPIGALSLNVLAGVESISPDSKVTVIDSGGEHVLKIQKSDEQFAYVEYEDLIYKTDIANVEFAYVDAFNTVSKLALLVDAAQTNKAVVKTADGEKFEIDIIHNGENEFAYKLNGRDIEKKAGAALYQEIIGLSADGKYTGEEIGSPEITIDFNKVGIHAEFSAIDDLRYALTKDDSTIFTIRRSKVNQMLEALRTASQEG